MSIKFIRRILALGAIAIAGILAFQSFWMIKTWDVKEEEFHQTVTIALRKVAESIARFNDTEVPKQNLITRRSSNIYAVNVNSAIDANILEDYLIREFSNHSLNTDFEYAVYDCATDDLVYGNYCNLSDRSSENIKSEDLPKFDQFIYYFVVKFTSRESYLIGDMWTTILFSGIALIAILSFIYAMWIIVRQKQLTELQKDFINNMTHEFKTPISSIKIASEVLLNSSNIKSDDRLFNYARIISDQNMRLNRQVEKVLNIARLEKDQFRLTLEDIRIDPFLQQIVDQESIKYHENDGRIKAVLNAPGQVIQADKLHLTNVLSNILDNALKYCRKNADVILESAMNGQNINISVRDKGIGMNREDVKKVFNKFFRVSTGNIHNVKGFGLGLFYVKNIVDAHGWRLNIESEEGMGTTVTISIPIIH